MPAVYNNWERLVTATLRREQLRESALKTPSDLSSLSASASPSPSPSFDLDSQYGQVSSLSFCSSLAAGGDSFTYLQILAATDCFNDSKLIKHGHSGDLYLGVVKSGIQVVIKKVNMSSLEKVLCLISEIKICGMVENSRLIPLLGHCLENADEKFLVYKYRPNRDLSTFLSAKIDDDRQSKSSLDWATRLKIATETAEGLCYLHHQCFPPLVHGDIQASSILLDEDFEVQLGSLTGACVEQKNNHHNRIERFLRLPMVFGQSNSGESKATCANDVYSFGKLLLELITGKLIRSAANDATVKNWIMNALRSIVSFDKRLIANIADSCLILDEHILVEVLAVALVAKACLSPKASKRPKMAEIVKALEPNNLARLIDGDLKLGGRIASLNHGSKVSRSIKVYPNGEILPYPLLRDFCFSGNRGCNQKFWMRKFAGKG